MTLSQNVVGLVGRLFHEFHPDQLGHPPGALTEVFRNRQEAAGVAEQVGKTSVGFGGFERRSWVGMGDHLEDHPRTRIRGQ